MHVGRHGDVAEAERLKPVFFDEWTALVRTAIVAVPTYAILVLFVRLAGKRTLSKLNAFDLVVTVSLGSTLATIVLNPDITLVRGALALALLILLQFVISWTSARLPWVRRLVTGEPTLLLHRGEPLRDALRGARQTMDDVRAAVRAAGIARLEDVEAVVLETDGSISVVKRDLGARECSSLEGIALPRVERRD